MTFQSTLPTRGSDARQKCGAYADRIISIHAPHEGERRVSFAEDTPLTAISIHAPHEGERPTICRAISASLDFNPRSPRGGATWRRFNGGTPCLYFNPRSPRGGATPPRADYTRRANLLFQSTLPTRGSDDQIRRRYKAAENFNPRSPRGGATRNCKISRDFTTGFQSTLPTRGSDDSDLISVADALISIHAPHEGERHA